MSKQIATEQKAQLPAYPNITLTEQWVPGAPGDPEVRILVYNPQNIAAPRPALLWIHGGGYVAGEADSEEGQIKAIVSSIGCTVVSVDYRQAPETPHPGPVEDCYAALKWLYSNVQELGVDSTRIATGGGSAGGGLAAALGLLARDRGEIPLCFQILIFPMLDDRTVTRSDPHPYTGEFFWTNESNRFGWTCLLGKEPGGPDVSPYAAAARAESLAELPPSFIAVGALDLFLEEDLEYARRLIRDGVPTELHIYPGAYHGFMLVPDAYVTQSFNQDLFGAINRAFKTAMVKKQAEVVKDY
jgi:acetyl esterase/lipase